MDALSSSLSGLAAASYGLNTIAQNVANVNTNGYQARSANQENQVQGGTQVDDVTLNQTPTVPGGSNVDLASAAVDTAPQVVAYQANLTMVNTQNQLLGTTFDMSA
jgi:flagellar hook protein FlgE